MARKQRVEVYLDPETVQEIEEQIDGPISAYIRNLVQEDQK